MSSRTSSSSRRATGTPLRRSSSDQSKSGGRPRTSTAPSGVSDLGNERTAAAVVVTRSGEYQATNTTCTSSASHRRQTVASVLFQSRTSFAEHPIICPICCDFLSDPRRLPTCLHSFCLVCIERYCSTGQPGAPLPCPVCREQFVVPANAAEFARDDVLRRSVRDSISSMLSLACEDCAAATAGAAGDGDSARDLTLATKYCETCHRKLCSCCAGNHSHRRRSTAATQKTTGGSRGRSRESTIRRYNHEEQLEVVRRQLREMYATTTTTTTTTTTSGATEEYSCQTHSSSTTEFYCVDCREIVRCGMCLQEIHRTHNWKEMSSAASQMMQQLERDEVETMKRLRLVKKSIKKLERERKRIYSEYDSTKNAIRQQVTWIQRQVEEQGQKLISQLERLEAEDEAEMSRRRESFELSTVTMETFVAYSTQVRTSGVARDVVQMAEMIHSRAVTIHKMHVIENSYQAPDITFTPSDMEALVKTQAAGQGAGNIVGTLTVSADASAKSTSAESLSSSGAHSLVPSDD